MLKKLVRFIRKYQIRRQKKRHHEHWAQLMKAGGAIRDVGEEKPDHRTQATVADDEILVDHMDSRMLGQRPVAPLFIDSANWGITKGE